MKLKKRNFVVNFSLNYFLAEFCDLKVVSVVN